jgi:excisionase family DNA binding protein
MDDIPPTKTSEPLNPHGPHHPIEATCSRELAANLQDPIAGTSLTTATSLKSASRKKEPAALRRHQVAHLKVENGTNPSFSRKNKREGSGSLAPILPIAVTVTQAANLIGTNDKQIRRAIYAREIPAARLGKSYSIAIADLIKWFDRKKALV